MTHPTLADRCAATVAIANQLTAYLPFTIVSLSPDAVDERVGVVRIRHDQGWEREAVTAMPFLCPATLAEAAMRAFMYANILADDDADDVPELDDADTLVPAPRKTTRGGLH